MALSSSGQDIRFSSWKPGFDSPWGYKVCSKILTSGLNYLGTCFDIKFEKNQVSNSC